MNPSILGLRTTIYKVSDLHQAKSWYARAFGLEPYFDEPFYVGFNIGGYELGLLPEEGDDEKAANVLTYWGITDIEQAMAHFLSAGATEHEAPQDVGGGVVVASVKDPWNNVIGLIINPSFQLP